MVTNLNKRKIFVTGAGGYIGKYLVNELLKSNCQVFALVHGQHSLSANIKNPRLMIVRGDINEPKSYKKYLDNSDIIIHLAASLRQFEKNDELNNTNIVGLKRLLEQCVFPKRKISFIFFSSIDAVKRQSDYARSKYEGEKIVIEFCANNPDVKPYIVRVGNVFDNEGKGMLPWVINIVNKRNWQSSVLYHVLGSKKIYLIERSSLIKQIIKLIKYLPNRRLLTLVDEEITVHDLIKKLKEKKRIVSYPKKLLLGNLYLKLWQRLGNILKKSDLIIYLSLEK